MNATLRGVLALPAAALLCAGIWTTVRISKGDFLFRRNTAASVQNAIRQEPLNGKYYAWLAELQEFDGQDSTAALDTAARLNPMDSRVWIRRGLNAELAGNLDEAEKHLLHAASIDRLMEPRWTLMNFYFRRQNAAAFWQWAHQTFAISYGDRTPLFELCWQMQPDARRIAAEALPPDDRVLAQFLRFLMDKQQAEQAAVIAEGIAPHADPANLPLFRDCIRRLVEQRSPARAVQLWNELSARRLIAFPPLDPAAGHSLTNPDLDPFPTAEPFDWQFLNPAGVSAARLSTGLRLTFSGSQDEGVEILRQPVPLLGGRRYRLSVRFATANFTGAAGLRLAVAGQSVPLAASPAAVEFTGEPLATIVLEYRRPAGSVRTEGDLTLQQFHLELLP